MCTVICRWSPGDAIPLRLLALRDEMAGRPFDPPGPWWPDSPDVIGGRDRRGGGTWCASDVTSGVTAVLLNRREKPAADARAPSRGVLPLLAVRAGRAWTEQVDVGPMAGFNLVLASPTALTWWSWDGADLVAHELAPGTHAFTPRGIADPPYDPRFVTAALGADDSTRAVWGEWLEILDATEVSDDPLALFVRVVREDGDVFETVFGQFIAARPGRLRLDYALTPDRRPPWVTAEWLR